MKLACAALVLAAAVDAVAGPRLEDDGSKIPSRANTVDEERTEKAYKPPDGLKPWSENPDDVDDGTVDWCETHPTAPACNVSAPKVAPPEPAKTAPEKRKPKPASGGAPSRDHAGMPDGGSGSAGPNGEAEDAENDAEKDGESAPRKGTAPATRPGGPGMNPAAARKAQAAAARGAALGRELNEQRVDSTPDRPAGKTEEGFRRAAPGDGGLKLAGGMDLAGAAASGYAASFAAQGLQMGADGRVRRDDGRLASRKDLRRLRERIESDPQALMTRPDFFNVVDRGAFERLKTDYGAKPEERDKAFTHVGMTDKERDFVRTESCNPKLDKGCNPAAEASYKKGDFVLPEELAKIDQLLHPDEEAPAPAPRADALGDEPEDGEEAEEGAAPAPPAAAGVKEFLARFFGGGGASAAAVSRAVAAEAPGSPEPAAAGRGAARGLAAAGLGATLLAALWVLSRRTRK